MQISWTYVLHNTDARASCTSSLRQMKQSQHSLDFFGETSFLSFAQKNEWLFSNYPLFMAILHWKYLFSVLPPGNLMILLLFLLSEISMELTECFEMNLVLRLFKVLVFLVKVQWLHSSPDHLLLLSRKTAYRNFSCLVHNFAKCTRHRRSFRVFCDKRVGAGVPIIVATLETWVSSLCVTRLGANVSSGIIEGMKG